jgi:hypothetical protein
MTDKNKKKMPKFYEYLKPKDIKLGACLEKLITKMLVLVMCNSSAIQEIFLVISLGSIELYVVLVVLTFIGKIGDSE